MKRRKFLHNSWQASLAASGLLSAGGMLKMVNAAAAQHVPAGGDYKALVCVFMLGGNDSTNTVVPSGTSEYNAYAQVRGDLALGQGELLNINQPVNNGGRQWGFHPALGGLRDLFNANRAAVVTNVGSLAYPITREEFNLGSVPVPPNLFSHSDQQLQWQAGVGDVPSITGWAGRIADLLHPSVNSGNALSMNISTAGQNQLQVGGKISQYQMNAGGSINLGDMQFGDGGRRFDALQALLGAGHSNLFEQEYATVFNRAIELNELISTALDGATPLVTPFPVQVGHRPLSQQLEMVARLISVRSQLGLNRQVFYCTIDGFDNHDNHLSDHNTGLQNVNDAIMAFQAAMAELGTENEVTLFTASDFSRTWRSNSQGSDHGWGACHFVVGGAVNGGNFYGDMPLVEPDSPNAVSEHGRVIPTVAVEEYAATLAQWFGVPPGDIAGLFPNIGRFNTSNMGFML